MLTQQTPHSVTQRLRCDLLRLQQQASALAAGNAPIEGLLQLLRYHQRGHAIIKGLLQAVHAAMGDEATGLLQNGQLIHTARHRTIGWGCAQLCQINRLPHRHDHIHVGIGKGCKAGAVEIGAVVLHRT